MRASKAKRRLVVGGGHSLAFPKLRPGDVSLNIDPDALPDVVGDIGRAPFVSEEFDEVYFEKVRTMPSQEKPSVR